MSNKIAGLPKIKKIFDNPVFLWNGASRKGGGVSSESLTMGVPIYRDVSHSRILWSPPEREVNDRGGIK